MRRLVAVTVGWTVVLIAGTSLAIEQIRPGDQWQRPKKVERFGLHKDNDIGLQYIAKGKFEQAIGLYQKMLENFDKKLVQDDDFQIPVGGV